MGQLGRVAEVSKLDFAGFVSQDVVTLDITMDNVVGVEVVQATKGLSHDPPESVFCVVLRPVTHGFDDLSERCVHEFNEDPENLARVIPCVFHVHAEAILPT